MQNALLECAEALAAIGQTEEGGKLMNIDERIEALTQTVELLAHMHQDNEKKWDERFGKMVDIVERLDRMIQIHDQRLNGNDDRLDNLERQ